MLGALTTSLHMMRNLAKEGSTDASDIMVLAASVCAMEPASQRQPATSEQFAGGGVAMQSEPHSHHTVLKAYLAPHDPFRRRAGEAGTRIGSHSTSAHIVCERHKHGDGEVRDGRVAVSKCKRPSFCGQAGLP